MNFIRFNSYTVEELLLDKEFKQIAQVQTDQSEVLFNSILESCSENTENILMAKKIIVELKEVVTKPSPTDVSQIKELVLDHAIKYKEREQYQAKKFNWSYLKVAASIVVAIGLGLLFLINNNNSVIHIKTGYGEKARHLLPDGSLIVINSNSSVSYNEDFLNSPTRQVWVDGEIFFEVTKRTYNNKPQKFTVQTPNMNLEVLGTSFNVNSRRNKTAVVLKTGRVKIEPLFESTSNALIMNPGELVELEKNVVEKKIVNPEKFLSWTDNKFVFDNTSLGEVAQIISDNYGYTVKFSDESFKNKTIVGSIPSDDLDTFIEILGESVGLKVTKENKQILFE